MHNPRKTLAAAAVPLLVLTTVVNLASCGTVLYPERHNQPPGRIDPGVAVLDAVGLFFFIIPGVIAFAVDFSNNSIYLPRGSSSREDKGQKYSKLPVSGKPGLATLENIIRAQTGKAVNLRQADVQVLRLKSAADLESEFALYGADNRVAQAK